MRNFDCCFTPDFLNSISLILLTNILKTCPSKKYYMGCIVVINVVVVARIVVAFLLLLFLYMLLLLGSSIISVTVSMLSLQVKPIIEIF